MTENLEPIVVFSNPNATHFLDSNLEKKKKKVCVSESLALREEQYTEVKVCQSSSSSPLTCSPASCPLFLRVGIRMVNNFTN